MIKIKHISSLLNEEKVQEDLHLSIFLYFTSIYSIINFLASFFLLESANVFFDLSTALLFTTLLILKNKRTFSARLNIVFFQAALVYALLIGYIISPTLVDGMMFIIVFPVAVVFLNARIYYIISCLSVYYFIFVLINLLGIANHSMSIFSLVQLIILHILITISIKFYIRISKLKDKLLKIRQSKLQKSKDRLSKANLETQKLNKILEELSSTDELTKIDNRRTILKNLKNRVQLYKRKDVSFAVVLVDIDHFKLVNDTYGHQKGDKVLIEVASQLEVLIRDIDNVGRYGGEEFLILIECHTQSKIIIALERLIEGIRTRVKCDSKDVTISIGATIINQQDSQESLIHRADEALYEAKGSGRNKYIFNES